MITRVLLKEILFEEKLQQCSLQEENEDEEEDELWYKEFHCMKTDTLIQLMR